MKYRTKLIKQAREIEYFNNLPHYPKLSKQSIDEIERYVLWLERGNYV